MKRAAEKALAPIRMRKDLTPILLKGSKKMVGLYPHELPEGIEGLRLQNGHMCGIKAFGNYNPHYPEMPWEYRVLTVESVSQLPNSMRIAWLK